MSENKKLARDIESTAVSKLLVICVDRDDDVGRKTGITTPVVGRDSCINAAQRLALEDPEDADSNSIFFAVKTYEDLVSKGYNTEVAVVTGVEKRGVQADEKIVNEIKSILHKFSANGAVIVSDGEDDEMVMAMREFGQLEGISASPEGGATLCALRTLLSQGMISPTDVVVLFNTGGALKYLELIE